MHRVIYLDTLVLLNTVVTYILLLSVREFASVKTSSPRLIGASFAGGIASLLILAPGLPLLITVPVRLLLCAALSFIAFFVGDRKKYFRCFCLLLLMTFAYGGILFFLSAAASGAVIYQNGFGYIGVNFWGIVGTVVCSYLAISLLRKKYGKGEERFYYEIEIVSGEKKAVGRALYDSGHFVSDCYTGMPVVIAARTLVCQLLSEEEFRLLKAYGDLSQDLPAGTGLKARCIPVRTVSGDRLLPAFTCDRVEVRNTDVHCRVDGVTLAMTGESADFHGCDALINQKLFESRG